MAELIIDAKGAVLGRLAATAAKQALLGKHVFIVNCEQAIITGDRKKIFADYKQARRRGTPKGPIVPRTPDRMVKRTIRGMLPYKQGRGGEAFKRIRCYRGVPEALKDKKVMDFAASAKVQKRFVAHITVMEVCAWLGAKQ